MVVPKGSLLNPTPPAPCGGRFIAMYAVIDAVADALAAARPELAVASSGLLTPYTLTGGGPDRAPWIHLAFEFGGVGARAGKDGPNGTGFHFGLGRNIVPQVEPTEMRCPFLIEEIKLRPDSGGAGQWRGGLGTRTTFLLQEDALITVRGDRHDTPPAGRNGGHSGLAGGYYRIGADGSVERLPDKAANVPLQAGDRFVVETSGGGGLGPPGQRDVQDVAADERAGWVTSP
jgi:N-methylhydantoinase B